MANSNETEASIRALGDAVKVDAIMTRAVFTLRLGDSLLMLVEALEGKGVRHVPVKGEDGKVCAVVTIADLLGFAPSLTSGLSPVEKSRVLSRFTVKDLLYPIAPRKALELRPTDCLSLAARRMREQKQDCALIYDESGALAGLVTETDFVKLFDGRAE